MACGRPGGLSDSDSDDGDFFFDAPRKRVPYRAVNDLQDIEIKIEKCLLEAISAGDLNTIQQIIDTQLRQNVNSKLSSGWTPLLHACHHVQDEVVEYLLEHGADVNLHAELVTPLMAVCASPAEGEGEGGGALRTARRLLAAGALLNLGDKYGQTALMRAVGGGHVALVRELLRERVNVEMRDSQGWTAVFWAVHHNQPEILELLMAHGARLAELDRSGRDPLEIAEAHGFQHLVDMLAPHFAPPYDDVEATRMNTDVHTWHDYYPSLRDNQLPDYSHEVQQLLYGMSCERLAPALAEGGVGLRALLLLDDAGMAALGVRLPFERRRLALGLRRFHSRGWRIDAVAGLYAQTQKHYSILECLTTAGSHLQQACVLECSVRYALREYARLGARAPREPAAPAVAAQAALVARNLRSIQREIVAARAVLKKVGANNPRPADLILPSAPKRLLSYTRLFLAVAVGAFLFARRDLASVMFRR